jgi:serine-type D-Ala-D-Ala carboxypeptidase/endopeptidase (penicillin-binding protein 4)
MRSIWRLSRGRRAAVPFLIACAWLNLLGPAAGAQPAATGQSVASTESVSRQIDLVLETPALAGAFVGAKIVVLRTGQVIYEKNADSYFVPASNMKLLTAVAAIETLGLDYRFRTVVAAEGDIRNGTLEGDLLILGSGDPTFGARISSWDIERLDRGDPLAPLRAWAEQLKHQGLQRIKGDVVGDTSVFGENGLGRGWAWDDLAWGYAAPITGLPFNENVVVVHLDEGEVGGTPRVRVEPADAPIRVVSLLRPLQDPVEEPIRALRASPETTVLFGRRNRVGPSTMTLSVDSPAYFARMFKETLERSGIKVEGQARIRSSRSGESPELKELVVYESPDLRWVIRVLLKVSQNLYAETLVKAMSPAVSAKTTEEGVRHLEQLLERIGMPREGYVIADGSGLSRYNLLTPNTLVKLLKYAYGRPYREDFVASLPVGGMDGTLRYRMAGWTASSRAQAKTGSLTNVRALSGYIRRSDGEILAFSLMINHFRSEPGLRVENFLDRIVAYLAE